MRERARDRGTRWIPPPDNFSADFLEEYSEEEDSANEERWQARRPLRRTASDDEAAAERLQAVKRGDDVVRGRAVVKKKAAPKPSTSPEPTSPAEPEEEDEEDVVEVRHKTTSGHKRRHVIEESDSE